MNARPALLACLLAVLVTGCAAGQEEPDSVAAPASAPPRPRRARPRLAAAPSAAPTPTPSAHADGPHRLGVVRRR